MKWNRYNPALLAMILLLLILAVTGCGRGKEQASGQGSLSGAGIVPPAVEPVPGAGDRPSGDLAFYERFDSGGGVEVSVVWLAPEYLQARGESIAPEEEKDLGTRVVFAIALTTHSGDLLSFDMARAARLEVNGRDAGPGTWEITTSDSHHPEGRLTFALPSGEEIRRLRLVITGLGSVAEREFVWDLASTS